MAWLFASLQFTQPGFLRVPADIEFVLAEKASERGKNGLIVASVFVRLLHCHRGGKLWRTDTHYPLPFILIPWQF